MSEICDNAFAETLRRREAIACADNPSPDRDYLVSLQFDLALPPPNAAACLGRLVLVPDRQILAPDGLDAYLALLAPEAGHGLEATAVRMFDDLNNQLIPRWISLSLSDGRRSVKLQDGQPSWRNDSLQATLHAAGVGVTPG